MTEDDVAWLSSNHDLHSHRQIADRYGICVDTAKRILMRLNLQYFPGAKYQIKPQVKTWNRPCITCGDTNDRASGQYKCEACTERELEAQRSRGMFEEVERRQPAKLEIPF